MNHPLIDRLARIAAAEMLSPDTIEAFEAAPGDAVLLFAGDPVRFPEGLDVAVVLPELRARFAAAAGHPWRVGIVARDCEDALARRWGVLRWPSLVFVREGGYLGTVSGMRDWEVYMTEVREILAGTPRRRPTVGIPVVSAGEPTSTCH